MKDIDLDNIGIHRLNSRKLTNRQRMQEGMPPITKGTNNGRDEVIELHHDLQNLQGPLIEVRETFNRRNHLHPYKPGPFTAKMRYDYGKDRSAYWEWRLSTWR